MIFSNLNFSIFKQTLFWKHSLNLDILIFIPFNVNFIYLKQVNAILIIVIFVRVILSNEVLDDVILMYVILISGILMSVTQMKVILESAFLVSVLLEDAYKVNLNLVNIVLGPNSYPFLI
jgi:hypothetical protein